MIEDAKTKEELILLSYEKKIKLHISLTNGNWRNGFVIEKPTVDFFKFKDEISGEEPIFFLQLKKVEPYVDEVKK